jgi:hypothetical protein
VNNHRTGHIVGDIYLMRIPRLAAAALMRLDEVVLSCIVVVTSLHHQLKDREQHREQVRKCCHLYRVVPTCAVRQVARRIRQAVCI